MHHAAVCHETVTSGRSDSDRRATKRANNFGWHC